MKNIHEKITLLLIFIFAFFMRVYKINQVPPGLYWDEVSIGYNAYSVLKTGKDEYGQKFPLIFRAFDDYKLPGQIYVSAFFIALFGENEFVIRLPSVFFGSLTVILIYFLTKGIISNFNSLSPKLISCSPYFASFFLAISPWHLQFSRASFEAVPALFFWMASTWFLLKGLKNSKFLIFSLPLLAISFYFYHNVRLIGVLFLVFFFLLYLKKLLKRKKTILLSGILAIILLLPIYSSFFSKEGKTRVEQLSLFGNKAILDDYKMVISPDPESFLLRTIFNRRTFFAWHFFKNYFSHFSFDFLFLEGDPQPRHHVAFMGTFYVIEFLFLISGLYYLINQKGKEKFLLFSWLFIAPLPAALTIESPHALRSFPLLPALVIINALGFSFLLSIPKKRILKILMIGFCLLTISFFFCRYLLLYYGLNKKLTSEAWAYGYKEMIEYVVEYQDNYDQVIISGHFWKPYVYYLFYGKIDPQSYLFSGSSQRYGKVLFYQAGWEAGGKELPHVDLLSQIEGKKTLIIFSIDEYAKIRKEAIVDKNEERIVFYEKFSILHTIFDLFEKEKFIIGEVG